jgi:hypothetical protein
LKCDPCFVPCYEKLHIIANDQKGFVVDIKSDVGAIGLTATPIDNLLILLGKLRGKKKEIGDDLLHFSIY